MVESSAFGETLKRAREARGVALDAVASATRIARHHLEALERSDLEALPGGPFGRSYLRSYAEFLGIDPEPILDSYRTEEADKGLGPAESRERAMRDLSRLLERRPARRRFRVSPWLGAVAAASALGALWWVSRGPDPSPPTQEQVPLVESAASIPEPVLPEAPDPEPVPATQTGTSLTVSESALGTGVVDHRLTGRKDRFSEGERVLFWTRVLAGKSGDVVHHLWLHEGRAVMRAKLPIGGSHWRTFSRFTLPAGATGTWVVEARDGTGRMLAREEFLCLGRGE